MSAVSSINPPAVVLLLPRVLLTGANALLLTSKGGTGSVTVVRGLSVCACAGAAAFSLSVYPPGVTTGAQYLRWNALPIAANATTEFTYIPNAWVIPVGYSIYAFGSVSNNLNIEISGDVYN